jgi:hypothetical protein
MVLVFDKPLILAGHLAVVMHFLHAGQEREALLRAEEPMTTVEFITAKPPMRRHLCLPSPEDADARLSTVSTSTSKMTRRYFAGHPIW